MNEKIENLLDKIEAYLAQPLLLNSELEAIKDQLNQILETDAEAYSEAYDFLAAITRAQNQLNLVKQPAAKPSAKILGPKTSENFFSTYYLPTDIQKIIFNAMTSLSEAALLGRTCKTLYDFFLTNYQLKEFEAIPLKSVNNTLFFHAPKQTPIQFLASLQITHIESNKKLASFFNPQTHSIFNAKKMVGLALFIISFYFLYDAFSYFYSALSDATHIKNKKSPSIASPDFWHMALEFLRFLFPLALGIASFSYGALTAGAGFIENNDANYLRLDSTLESAVRYRNQQLETKMENEIYKIIKSLKRATSETRFFKTYSGPVLPIEEPKSNEFSAPKPKWI